MKKRLILFATVIILLCMVFSLPACAKPALLVDDANLLSDSEQTTLSDKLNTISAAQQCDIVIVTVNSLGNKTAMDYADDYYDYNDYGYGDKKDGILFLISMEERDWRITTTGSCIQYFTDNGQNSIEDKVVGYLSDGDYYDAFMCFANLCDEFITQGKTGTPYDVRNKYESSTTETDGGTIDLTTCLICLGIGLVIAFIVTGIMRSQLKSVKLQFEADDYVRSGSMNVTNSHETFLGRSVTRTAIPKNDSGGSSTHFGSSGTSHGGSGGKF